MPECDEETTSPAGPGSKIGGPIEGEPWEIDGELEEGQGSQRHRLRPDGHGLIVTDEGSLVQPFRLDRDGAQAPCHGEGDVPLLRAGEEADLEGLCFDGELVLRHGLARARPQDARPPAVAPSCLPIAARADGDLPAMETSHALEPLLESDGLLAGTTASGSTATSGGSISRASPSADGRAAVRPAQPIPGWPGVPALGRHRWPVRARSQPTAESSSDMPWRLAMVPGSAILRPCPEGVLVLSGPSTDEDERAFDLWHWGDDRSLEHLAGLRTWCRGQGRGAAGPDGGRQKLKVLVVFDGVKRGGPHQFDCCAVA